MPTPTLVSIFVCLVLCFGAALGARKELRSTGINTIKDDDGICKTRVQSYGYPCEDHTVTTDDGYILGIQRIPRGRSGVASTKNKSGIPVLLQHGLFMDGITWLLNSPDESLGYILADKGYDVWIGNSRGTVESIGHTSLSPTDSAYWNWSWDELAAYDLPATLQYIYQQTGQQAHYVAHSLGTTLALGAICDQRLNNSLRSAVLLSPIAYMGKMASPLARAAADLFLGEVYYWLGLHEFHSNSEAAQNLRVTICSLPGIDCYDFMDIFTGKNCCLNSSTVEIYEEHEPQATSTRNMIHLAQMIRKGTITKYDYGNIEDNMERYGQASPPAYNISGIPNDLPLYIGYGGKDELSDVNDVQHLIDSLKFHDVDKLTVHYVDSYAHADLSMGVNAKEMIYDSVMEFFKLH